MFNLSPKDMGEVAQKLAYLQTHGQPDATETDVLLDTARAGAQDLLDEALEGPYYNVRWQTPDQVLVVTGALKNEIGTLTPRADCETFSADFKGNEILFWRNLSGQIAALIRQE